MTTAVSEDLQRTAARLVTECDFGTLQSITPLAGGRNNRVYRVTATGGTGILKHYYFDPNGGRDRWASEVAWSEFCNAHQVHWVPLLLASDRHARCALFVELTGRNLQSADVTIDAVRQAAEFIRDVNRHRQEPEALALPLAADANFSLADHATGIQRRLDRLAASPISDDLDARLNDWLRSSLDPVWQQAQDVLRRGLTDVAWGNPLPHSRWCLSPSDFGFHNTWRLPSGDLRFLDFEYAGWDDPAKLVCDFYWQVDLPAPRSTWAMMGDALADIDDGLIDRVRRLFPSQGIKWCCILLNEFLPADQRRRAFADETIKDHREEQWDRARTLLSAVQAVMQQAWPPHL